MAISPGGRPIDYSPLGPNDLWHTKGLKLPPYIRGVAHGINPADPEAAIDEAVASMKRWAAGGQHVHPAVRAAAIKALAEWEAARAAAHALSARQGAAIDLAAGAMTPLPGTDRPRYPIRNHDELRKAIKAVGRAKGDHAKVRRHIIARANAIGGTHLLPENWTSGGNLK